MLRSFSPALLAAVSLVTLGTAACTGTPEDTSTEAAAVTSAPMPVGSLAGEFRFAGGVEAIGRLTVDVIDERMADAQTRLEALRQIGATCERRMANTIRCHKLHPAGTVPAASLAAIGEANRQAFATFGAAWGAPSIVTDGDSFKEWTVPVDGASDSGAFRLYKWRQLGENLTKIVLPGRSETEANELIVKDASHLARWTSKVTTESRWRFHEDIALVILEK